MEISVSTGFSYKRSHEEVLDAIACAGATRVELMFNQAFHDVPLPEIARALKARKLAVPSVHSALDFLAFPRRQDEWHWIERSLDACRELGASLVVTHMVWGQDFEDDSGHGRAVAATIFERAPS